MLKIDSRKIEKGDIFLALDNGHNYIENAIKNGCKKVIAEYGNYDVETIIVESTRDYLANYLKEKYYDEIKDINLIGITGTNGKTTTSYLLYQALNKLNITTAYIGTIGFYINNKVIDTLNTTPNIYELYEYLLMCKKYNIKYVVMEVSSQGIDMKRVEGLNFKYVAFTNLTQDHLDYHKTMDNYLNCKLKLFEGENKIAIINTDDSYSKHFILDKNENILFGKKGENKIEIINTSLDATIFKLNEKEYKTKLIGEYNVYNLCIVILFLNYLGLDDSVISDLNPPTGRMDIIKYGTNNIVIDYAHTPDAVENILKELNKIEHNRIITIIGCGGNRDKSKRPIMGKISSLNSDFCIYTSDNPRYENKMSILKDITQTLDTNNYQIIVNRKKAIKKGIQMLKNNDILLIAGKGHETYQIIKNKKKHFSDKEEVLKLIRR